ncbi:hypothetical protein BDZ94DRAFT_1317808 [Collybia nuda]|uniref:Uncharacterized protein n=1 Tax=Collybia nuda TaxID=64659 RepID=A0A9P5YHC1_9AGAR|nr:hypothetical protein BDZ94DRAFT_1317808 [Collybia nuda]
MSFRAAQPIFSTTARASLRAQRANVSGVRMGGRRMNSSHVPPKTSSDKQWIIVSSLVFGPAFLYLVSPSARKSTHSAHNDKHDFPAPKTAKHVPETVKEPEPEPVIMKDDEGTEANVAESLQQAESADVPKAASAAPIETETAATTNEQPTENSSAPEGQKETADADSSASKEDSEAKGTFQESGEKGPTDMGTAREAAAEGIPPKEAKEKEETPSS